MVLSCHKISKAYGTDEIIKDVSFQIEQGEKAAIIGNNGAGKSTLLKIITGEITPDDGEVVTAKDTVMGYLAQYQGLSELANASSIKDDTAVTFISGATISSNAVYQGVCAALQQYQIVQGGAN